MHDAGKGQLNLDKDPTKKGPRQNREPKVSARHDEGAMGGKSGKSLPEGHVRVRRSYIPRRKGFSHRIGALAMRREIEAFALLILRDAQPDRPVDQLEQHQRDQAGPDDAKTDSPDLR
jgi:hypothetical protein